MRLTATQRRLRDRGTPAQQTALRLLVSLGNLYDAQRLVPVTSAHVSGASFKLIGDPGLEFLEDFAKDARFVVPTTVNPLGTDLRQWRELGVPPEFAEKQARVARAYETMGVRPVYSCTPYLLGVRPALGEHVAWSESNAVCFANSVLGARTNREGGPSALAAAIVGATPDYGLHQDAERQPTVVFDVRARLDGIGFSLLGLLAGKEAGDGIPFFRGFRATEGDLKWLGAAAASAGSVGMFHLEGITPEWKRTRIRGLRKVIVTPDDLEETRRHYSDGNEAELIALGSPQLSPDELRSIAALVDRTPPRIPVWVFTSRLVRDACPEAVASIERAGGRVLADTCLEVTLLEHRFTTVATPSGKGAYYLPSLCRQKVILDDVESLLERYA
ncbi:MAG TPA: aconitase X catalytic domain-containing protein [Thermoplasmata archaeon]|nr:aconitase X catalytic domain-containing protein [Thermoplasmata archaeon]